MPGSTLSRHVVRWRLALFAAGDFAFNLYWQSVMLYLLFYYTEALHLTIATASLCYAIASVWDGFANFAVGIYADRYGRPERFHRWLTLGAAPLGLSFALAYVPPPFAGGSAIAWVIGSHLLFRTAYAFVNVPYLAMSARITVASSERALVAAGRMLFGTIAAVVVAVTTIPLGHWLSGNEGPAAYGAAAVVFALTGSVLLVIVGITYRDSALPPAVARVEDIATMVRAVRNRAFLALCAAMMAMIVAVTVLDKSVLYFFKYALGDQAAGQLTLGWMMAVSGIAVPIWLFVSRITGTRGVWFAAILACIICLLSFIFADIAQPLAVRVFLVAIQGAIVGLHFAFWSLLPDTVEYGQHSQGVRAEALLYGVAALLQRLAIGLGTLLVGISLGRQGLHRAAADDTAFRTVLAVIPLAFFALAGILMLANPMRRGSHDRILAELNAD